MIWNQNGIKQPFWRLAISLHSYKISKRGERYPTNHLQRFCANSNRISRFHAQNSLLTGLTTGMDNIVQTSYPVDILTAVLRIKRDCNCITSRTKNFWVSVIEHNQFGTNSFFHILSNILSFNHQANSNILAASLSINQIKNLVSTDQTLISFVTNNREHII